MPLESRLSATYKQPPSIWLITSTLEKRKSQYMEDRMAVSPLYGQLSRSLNFSEPFWRLLVFWYVFMLPFEVNAALMYGDGCTCRTCYGTTSSLSAIRGHPIMVAPTTQISSTSYMPILRCIILARTTGLTRPPYCLLQTMSACLQISLLTRERLTPVFPAG